MEITGTVYFTFGEMDLKITMNRPAAASKDKAATSRQQLAKSIALVASRDDLDELANLLKEQAAHNDD